MRLFALISTLFLFLPVFTGCTSFQKSANLQQGRIEYLNHQLRQSQSRVEQLRSENIVLRTKIRRQGGASTSIQRDRLKPPSVKLARTKAKSGKTRRAGTRIKSIKTKIKNTFKKVVSSYRNQNSTDLDYYVNVLIDRYPESLYGDNALYLHGKHFYRLGKLSLALKSFDRALKLFPKGNKRASILLAKSMIYKKLELNEQAEIILKEIMGTYPGSMEADRAQLELTPDSAVPRERI